MPRRRSQPRRLPGPAIARRTKVVLTANSTDSDSDLGAYLVQVTGEHLAAAMAVAPGYTYSQAYITNVRLEVLSGCASDTGGFLSYAISNAFIDPSTKDVASGIQAFASASRDPRTAAARPMCKRFTVSLGFGFLADKPIELTSADRVASVVVVYPAQLSPLVKLHVDLALTGANLPPLIPDTGPGRFPTEPAVLPGSLLSWENLAAAAREHAQDITLETPQGFFTARAFVIYLHDDDELVVIQEGEERLVTLTYQDWSIPVRQSGPPGLLLSKPSRLCAQAVQPAFGPPNARIAVHSTLLRWAAQELRAPNSVSAYYACAAGVSAAHSTADTILAAAASGEAAFASVQSTTANGLGNDEEPLAAAE